ncbi:MAG: ABC transporter permease, partial [Anaerolineales bacterium]|nr:ABC transporter permease [Anaerolineales bacterium]
VDLTGLVMEIPDDLPVDTLVAFEKEGAAREALNAGEITAYYIIPEDYIETGDLFYVYPSVTPLSSDGQDWVMRWALLVNMLGGEAQLAQKVWNPMDLDVHNLDPSPGYDRYAEEDCSRPGYACESNVIVQMIPLATIVLIYVFIAGGASMLLRNVANEKQNRMIEILMTSVNSSQMFTGKIIGLGIASLLPTLVWVGTSFTLLRVGGSTLNLPEEFTLPFSLLVGWLIFFLLGYALYASLMAGVGALAPNLKEANQAIGLIMLPMVIGYMLSILPPTIEAPHEGLALGLSIFPLTAPFAMVMRLVVGGVPAWQIVISAGLLIVSIVFVVRGVARTFRAQSLLSGQPFTARRYISTLMGKS